MEYPTLNLNGSRGQTLLDDYCAAGHAIRVAIQKLVAIAPHGRDYQTLLNGSLQRAVAEHNARVAALQAIHRDLQSLAASVSDQIDIRQRARE